MLRILFRAVGRDLFVLPYAEDRQPSTLAVVFQVLTSWRMRPKKVRPRSKRPKIPNLQRERGSLASAKGVQGVTISPGVYFMLACSKCGQWHLEAEKIVGRKLSCTKVKRFWTRVRRRHAEECGHITLVGRNEDGEWICLACRLLLAGAMAAEKLEPED